MTEPRWRLTAGVVLVAVVSACSGGPGGAATPSASPVVEEGTDLREPGPLEAYVDAGYDLTSTQGFTAWHLETEEAIAACMAEQGFDYVPVRIDDGGAVVAEGPPRGTRGYAERYGYGVWDGPEHEPGQVTAVFDDAENVAYRDSLSPTAQQAYLVALYGEMIVDGDTTTLDGTGCTRIRHVGAGADVDPYLVGVVTEARAFLDSIWQGTDPRLAEVDAAWASCMVDAGYTESSPATAEAWVVEEIIEYDESGAAPVDPAEAAEVVAERAAAERRLALADMDCREETDWTARRRAVEIELQQEYVETHQGDLDALAEAAATG